MHDPHYDKYMKQSAFTELGQFSISDRKYSGAALNDEFCPYWVKVYPSSRMEDQYKTNDPVVFTVVAVCIFLFTSVVFLGYDFLNTTRQKRIMASALQTNAIVSSLFPNVVRDRVLNPGVVGATESSAFNEGTPKLRLKSYLREDVKKATGQESKSSPIAEFFSDTTVLFADIAGFTAWSSVREPSQVFTLLEALYGSFDEIARKRGGKSR